MMIFDLPVGTVIMPKTNEYLAEGTNLWIVVESNNNLVKWLCLDTGEIHVDTINRVAVLDDWKILPQE